MAPARARQPNASAASAEVMISTVPPSSSTPTTSTPPRRTMSITAAQKQALIDNLQLEITERARKLRAQYALQAQGLRARLEMRVNRIPQAMRKRNIQDVLDAHTEKPKQAPPPPMPVQGRKRHSDQISTDKENLPNLSQEDVSNPKKRTRTVVMTAANTKAVRTASRKVAAPSNVLSPRSNNSRTLPRSPIKPSSNQAGTKTVGARGPSRQVGKRGAAAELGEGRSSEASNTSAATTIVTKPGAKKAAVVRKPTTTNQLTTAGRKPVATGGRILRKRG